MPGSGIFADLVEPAPAPAPVVEPAPAPPVDPGPPSNIFADLVATPVTSRDGDRVYDGVDHSNEHSEPSLESKIQNSRGFDTVSNLATLFEGGPVGPLALAKETVGDRYADMRAKGHGPFASGLAAAADGALFYAIPAAVGKGAQAIRAGLKIAEPVTRIGATAAHAFEGGATGVLLPEGSAAISAASGDPERARAELKSVGESGLAGLGLGGVSGLAAGPHLAAPTGVFSDLVAPERTDAGRGRPNGLAADAAPANAPAAGVVASAPAPAESRVPPTDAVVGSLLSRAPAEPGTAAGVVPERAAPEPAPTSAAVAPSGIFADLAPRTPVAEGQKLNSIESLRNRAAANARGELDQPKPSAETPTPITGSPVLPEGTDHVAREQAPAAAAHVQGAPGESAAPADHAVAGQEGEGHREQAPAEAAQAGQVGQERVSVNRDHDVPLFGGTSEDGKTVYIDRNAPHTVDVNGKPADVDKYTAIHERAEKPLLDQGMSYADAHDHATAVENAALRADGHDPEAYNAALKEHIDAAAAKTNPKTPPDLERKPYDESGVKLPEKGAQTRAAASAPRTAHGDILDAMIEEGGIEPRPKDLTAGAGEHDDRPKLTGKARAAYSGNVPPDLMAKRLQERGYGDGTVNTMHRLAREAQETRQAEPGQHADDVMAHDSSAPPESNQRATSKRPDLAIPTTDNATRDAYKQMRDDARGTEPPEVRTRESQRQAADERIANDPEGEAKRAIDKVNRGEALNEQEQHVLLVEAQMHLRAGDVEEFARHMLAYDRAGTESARAFGARSDPAEPPGKRAQSDVVAKVTEPDKATQQAMDAALKAKNAAEYKRLADAHVAQVKQHLVDIAKKSGIDPLDLAGEKKSPKASAKEKVAKASLETRREFGDLLKQLKDSLRKSSSAGAFGGEQADLIAKIIANRIKAGLLKAADVALDIAKALPRLRRDPAMQQAFADAWKAHTGEAVDREALFGKATEAKSERDQALDKLAKAAERHQQSPEERRAALDEKRTGKKSRDPEVQAILDTARELDAEVRKRDAAGKADPTLDQQVAAARDRLAKAIDAHDTAMGQSDAERTATLAARANKPALHPEVQKLLDEAKALGAKVRERDEALKPPPTLDEQVSSAQKQLNAAIERHHAAMGQTPAERLAAIEAKAKDTVHPEVQKLLDQRKALDSAVQARDRLIYRNALRVIDASRTLKADAWDKFDEAYRAGLHTSLGLPWYKISSDLTNKLHSFIADDIGAAIINHIIPGGSDPRSLADAPYILKAIIPSMVRGAQHGLESMREDRNVFADEIRAARAAKDGNGLGEADEFHQQTHALGTTAHNLLGWNIRTIAAEQSGIESAFAHAQVAAEAYRLAFDANGKRLTGEALHDFMHAQVEDITSPAWTNAIEVAHRDTSVQKPSIINFPVYFINAAKNYDLKGDGKVATLARSTPGAFPLLRTAQSALKMVAPFTTLPSNIVTRGIYGMTPLNGATIAVRTARAFLHAAGATRVGAKYGRAQFNTDLSRHIMGWLVAAGVSYAMYDKDGKRRITGYHYDPKAADLGEGPAHSIKALGKWWDYGKFLGASGHAVGTLADAFDAAHSVVAPGAKVSPDNALKAWFSSMKEHLVGESFMRGVSDIAAAARSEGGGAKYAGTLAASFVPTVFHQTSKAFDDAAPSHRTKEGGFFPRAAEAFRQQLGIHETPAIDVFGKTIPKDDPLSGPVTGPLARLLSPIHGKVADLGDDAQPYRNLIMRWNDTNPGDKLKFGSPEPFVVIGRKHQELTPQQYHDLCADAGQRTMTMLGRVTLNTDEPTKRDATMLANAVKAGQEAAREAMKGKIAREAATPLAPHPDRSTRYTPSP